MEGLFLVGSLGACANELGAEDNKEHGFCGSTNSVVKKKKEK